MVNRIWMENFMNIYKIRFIKTKKKRMKILIYNNYKRRKNQKNNNNHNNNQYQIQLNNNFLHNKSNN